MSTNAVPEKAANDAHLSVGVLRDLLQKTTAVVLHILKLSHGQTILHLHPAHVLLVTPVNAQSSHSKGTANESKVQYRSV